MADFLGIDGQYYPEDYFYGVDGCYHPPGQVYRPAVNADGEYIAYRPESSPYKIEGGTPPYGSPGSFYGVDGKRHPAHYYYGVDGEYHHPDTQYNLMTGQYTDPPPSQK